MVHGNCLDLQASRLNVEITEGGVRKIENWLRKGHNGLFQAVVNNEADNEMKIKYYCNKAFKVFLNDRKYLQSYFTAHKICQELRQIDEKTPSKKSPGAVFEDEFSPVLKSVEMELPSNNISDFFLNLKPFIIGNCTLTQYF